MPKYVIEQGEKYVIEQGESSIQETPVGVKLIQEPNGSITLLAGGWSIFKLKTNGKGCLPSRINEHNKEGIIVDSEGRLVIEYWRQPSRRYFTEKSFTK